MSLVIEPLLVRVSPLTSLLLRTFLLTLPEGSHRIGCIARPNIGALDEPFYVETMVQSARMAREYLELIGPVEVLV